MDTSKGMIVTVHVDDDLLVAWDAYRAVFDYLERQRAGFPLYTHAIHKAWPARRRLAGDVGHRYPAVRRTALRPLRLTLYNHGGPT